GLHAFLALSEIGLGQAAAPRTSHRPFVLVAELLLKLTAPRPSHQEPRHDRDSDHRDDHHHPHPCVHTDPPFVPPSSPPAPCPNPPPYAAPDRWVDVPRIRSIASKRFRTPAGAGRPPPPRV